MKNLKYLLIIAVSAIIFSGCAKEPSAMFTVDKTEVYVGEEISFTNMSIDADTYKWDFGDGKTSTEVNPKHFYDKAGTYTVVLLANTKKDASSYSLSVTVKRPNEFVVNNIHYPITDLKVVYEDMANGGRAYYLFFYNKDELIYNPSEQWFTGRGSMLEIDLYANSLEGGTYRYNSSTTSILGTSEWIEAFTDYDFDIEEGSSRYAMSGSVIVTKDGSHYSFEVEFTDENAVKVTGYAEGNITITL